jgi:hypothetical protein
LVPTRENERRLGDRGSCTIGTAVTKIDPNGVRSGAFSLQIPGR